MTDEHSPPLPPLTERRWKNDAPGRFVASIDNIEPTLVRIDLSENLAIRRSSKDEDFLFSRLSQFSMTQPGQVVAATTVPAMKYFEAEMLARERFELVQTALRLLGARQAHVGDGFAVQDDDLDSAKPVPFWLRRSELPGPWRFVPYKLDRAKGEGLRETYSRLPPIQGPARVALNRFDSAHTRQTEEDRFIDVWIGLEALFSPTDKLELRYRIALRAARYIGDSADDREEVYRTLLGSYDLRSQVVHGRKLTIRQPKGLGMTAHEVVSQTEDYLRRALERAALSQEGFRPEGLDIVLARGD